MAQRGQKSIASKTTTAALVPGQCPDAPIHLTEAQAEVWKMITRTKTHDWFQPDTYDLLAALCVHIIALRDINARMNMLTIPDGSDYDEIHRFDKMTAIRDRESKRVEVLSRSMRLTQQSRWQPKTAATKQGGASRKPWES
jgi:hypothetical protein